MIPSKSLDILKLNTANLNDLWEKIEMKRDIIKHF